MKRATVAENIKVSIRSIRSQLLRTILTVSIIAIGIMALVSMVTATESLKSNIQQEFSSLGTNTFTVEMKRSRGRRMGRVEKQGQPITYRQAKEFKENYNFDARVGLSAFGSSVATLKRAEEKTNPNVQVLGIDENYLRISGYELASGRGFTPGDMSSSQNLVILGQDIVNELFKEWEDPVDAEISIGSFPCRVVGVLASKGQVMGMSQDNQCFITLSNLRKQYATENTNYSVSVQVSDARSMDDAISEAYGVFRVIRQDAAGAASSFDIQQSSAMIETMLEGIDVVTIAATVIGIITLFGAGIGLMNIMLVSVTERTREIGVRKAIGASAAIIRMQFLVEAIVIGQIGGFFGILLGLLIGNMVSLFFETPFVIPWLWIIVGVTLCFLTSVISGYYPAKRAAALDPIESLRYE